MTKISFSTCLALLAVLFVTAVIPVNAARIVSIMTCGDVSGSDFIPVGITDNFGNDAESIHAVAVLEDVRPGTMISGIWVSVDAIEVPNYQIDSTSIKASSPETRAHFALSRPTNGWPTGNYRLDLYIGGKFSTSVPFKIGQATPKTQITKQSKSNQDVTPGPTGTWQSQTQYGVSILVFQSSNKIWLDGESFDYKIVGKALRVTDEYGSQDYPFTLKGSTLSIDFGEGYKVQYAKLSNETTIPNDNMQADYGQEAEENSGYSPQQGGYSGGDAGLMQHFAGTWWNATRNTETTVTLTADGRYYENYSASYSGSSNDQYGNQDMSWGAANDQGVQGTWSVQGSREQGQLTITYQNGNQRAINYNVHVENGQTYWSEYYFNGELYGKK